MAASPQRHHPLPGTQNFRDIGGYPTRDGRQTRWGVLFRSDSLHALTPEGQEQLLRLGVRSIIDLRRSHDLQNNPHILAEHEAVDYLHLPVFEIDFVQDESITSAFAYLRGIVIDHAPGVVQAMTALAVPGRLPAAVHCIGGTHRTGTIIALCLRLAGVPDEVILEDFALTDIYSVERQQQTRERRRNEGWSEERINWFVGSPPQALAGVLKLLDEQYGGVEGYLRAGGMTDSQINALREQLVEQAE